MTKSKTHFILYIMRTKKLHKNYINHCDFFLIYCIILVKYRRKG